jgi:chorismate mutase / prephenate dehydratase
MTLKDIRNKIDTIDKQIIELLHRRMEYAIQAGRFKNAICDPDREEAIFRNVTSGTSELLDKQFINNLYGLIIEKSKQLQQHNLQDRCGPINHDTTASRKDLEVTQ